MSDAALRAEIESEVTAQCGRRATVVGARPLAGGASMETWAIDLDLDGERLALVLRRDMGANMFSGALSRAQEFALLAAAHAHGVRAPRPRWLHAGATRAWFLMDRLPGESVGRRVVKLPELAHAREGLAREMGEQLARIHALDVPDSVALPRVPDRMTPAEASLATIRAECDTLGRNSPVWTYALRWLARHAPPPSGPHTVVHGDFRIGNLLVAPEGLTGVLDWEFAHRGDPLEDLAWPLVRDWRFECDALHVGGVGHLDPYLAAYESSGGRRVDRGALAWWEAVGNLRWAVFCHSQAERHLRGKDRSVELASLGRKSAEMEWELLRMIRAMESVP